MQSDKPHIIIDNGSSYIKAGFSGEKIPKAVFMNNVGSSEDSFYGVCLSDAELLRKRYDPKHPVERGFIVDWDAMEKVWEHTFNNELTNQ